MTKMYSNAVWLGAEHPSDQVVGAMHENIVYALKKGIDLKVEFSERYIEPFINDGGLPDGDYWQFVGVAEWHD